MRIIPIMTEKSTKLFKDKGYTFWVPANLNKLEIKSLINKIFKVDVISIKTMNIKGGTKRNLRGKIQKVKGGKKAVVFIKKDQKIDIFEEEKKTRSKKGGKRAKA